MSCRLLCSYQNFQEQTGANVDRIFGKPYTIINLGAKYKLLLTITCHK